MPMRDITAGDMYQVITDATGLSVQIFSLRDAPQVVCGGGCFRTNFRFDGSGLGVLDLDVC